MVDKLINPPSMKAPMELMQNPNTRHYFRQLDYYLYLLWQKTGGGSDPINSSVQSVVGGEDITVDSTDPQNPIVNFAGNLGDFETLIDYAEDEEISSQTDDYTTFKNETILMTKSGSTLKLNATPNDKETVYAILGTDMINIDGNGKKVSGEKILKVYRKYTCRRIVYFLALDEWFVS